MLALQRSAGNRAVVGRLDPGTAVQRKFKEATVGEKSHLRAKGRWSKMIGPAIKGNDRLLVDDDDAKASVEDPRRGLDKTWRPAVNVAPEGPYAVPGGRRGYIRASKVTTTGQTFEELAEAKVGQLLALGEQGRDWLTGKLNTQDHVDFLMNKSLRSTQWVDSEPDVFADALTTLEEKYQRIREGALYVGKVLEHWKQWLYPGHPEQVTLTSMRLVKSDLHERGLGVVEVRFRKPANVGNAKFRADTDVHAFLKPEDKSLEQNLFGSESTSAVNKINTIAGLAGNERLRSIRMESTAADDYGTLVEAARGVQTEDIMAQFGDGNHTEKSFHETMVLAYLAGIDDLHKKNVFFEKAGTGATPGVPTLVDADNVMSWSQMNRDQQESSGGFVQSGFGQYNRDEAQKNQAAIQGLDNSQIGSKILDKMINDPVKRRQIITALEAAITGKKGRVVPIRTQKWGSLLSGWPGMSETDKNQLLDSIAKEAWLVRKGRKFSADYGPGLYGVTGENAGGGGFRADVARAEIRADFDKGAIPFYEYDFTTGVVTHNGEQLYEGTTLDQAMTAMLDRFGG